jgi:hydrophobic/amphiphilic exporter-1 (mainly G- bacteria), HAE1 family
MVFLQNWGATLVPATTVPVTIIGAFAAMFALGFSINLMTLFALILAIGTVVDDAIGIVENSSYHIEQGLPPREVTIKAMREIAGPVLGITLFLTAVFLPAVFLRCWSRRTKAGPVPRRSSWLCPWPWWGCSWA